MSAPDREQPQEERSALGVLGEIRLLGERWERRRRGFVLFDGLTPAGDLHSLTCSFHDTVATCACGENYACRTCGFGAGSYPCACSPVIELQPW